MGLRYRVHIKERGCTSCAADVAAAVGAAAEPGKAAGAVVAADSALMCLYQLRSKTLNANGYNF